MANCETCKGKEAKTPETIPYMAHEFAMVRMERTAKRLWITILTLIFLLVGSNCAWLWYNAQFETVETINGEAEKMQTTILPMILCASWI